MPETYCQGRCEPREYAHSLDLNSGDSVSPGNRYPVLDSCRTEARGVARRNHADVSGSAHQRAGLGEGPAVAFGIGGFVGAEAVLVDVLDDLGAVRLGVCEVGVEVVDVDERRVRNRSARA